MVKVTGDDSGRMTEKILRHPDAADVTEVGSECELSLKIPRQSSHALSLSLSFPLANPCTGFHADYSVHWLLLTYYTVDYLQICGALKRLLEDNFRS